MVTLLHRISAPAPKPPPAALRPPPGDLGALSSVFPTVPTDVKTHRFADKSQETTRPNEYAHAANGGRCRGSEFLQISEKGRGLKTFLSSDPAISLLEMYWKETTLAQLVWLSS